ncbi:hypothetical protein [Streptomyces sp. NK08204]|uniref:hypothetical protein n=1 Tax=Streptomyces sp. NK08204 TaxID=2873260 RepID=UPI001CEC1B4F|nr:hypothetical protein [Streptomyces sp. NK08204]
MAHDTRETARLRLAALTARPAAGGAPAYRLAEDAALLGRLLAVTGRVWADAEDVPEITVGDIGAALSLFDGLRLQVDRLESQVVMEARRRGMDWRQIAQHQGLNSSQAASQRHQRLTTRLEEIRQGVR